MRRESQPLRLRFPITFDFRGEEHLSKGVFTDGPQISTDVSQSSIKIKCTCTLAVCGTEDDAEYALKCIF